MTPTLLNWREIDAIIAEWPSGVSWLRRIRQPDFRRVILEFSNVKTAWSVVVVLAPPYPRVHLYNPLKKLPKALPKPPRFTAVLKSRLEGAGLESVGQLRNDRIVRFRFDKGDSTLFLDAKLWGNSANLILSDADGRIIDAFSRRPKRGETPGEKWPPEGIGPSAKGHKASDEEAVETRSFALRILPDGTAAPDPPAESRNYALRILPGEGNWNARVEAYFTALEAQADSKRRIGLWETHLNRREVALDARKRAIGKNESRFGRELENGRWGDILMAHLHEIPVGANVLEAEDWEGGGTVRIPLDASLGAKENAERYYERRKKAVRALERLEEDRRVLERTRAVLTDLRRRLEEGDTDAPPFDADPPEGKHGRTAAKTSLPGLWIRKSDHIIVVGRGAVESDTLLRRWARGNDLWLHARDFPGGHVFVRSPRGRSVPLEVLLDAGNLALSYSKGKNSGEADLYYTQVKNLRRAKGRGTGTVLPTREKNLRVKLDSARLEALKALAETG